MKYCKFCGTEIGDANFCPHCGKPQHTAQENRTGRRRLHCPQCRGEQLTAITEATQTGGVATSSRLTRNITVTGYNANTVNRHYWMCQECGHKFRNLEDLDKELVTETKRAKMSKIAAIVFGILCLLFMFSMMGNELTAMLMIVPLGLLIGVTMILCSVWHDANKKVKNMIAEKAHLEQHCFD